jgi:DNA-binding NtrC family response regulator
MQHILRVLEHHHGNRERAAAALNISRRTLYRRLKELRSRRSDPGSRDRETLAI